MPHIRRQPCVFSGHRLLRNLKLQKINSLKKLKINYLLIGIVTLLLAAACGRRSWSGKPENRVAGIIARGELRISTINSPMTFATMNNKAFGLDYELAKQFADYLGVTLKITVRQNISQLFDDLDDGQADMLAAGLVYNRGASEKLSGRPHLLFCFATAGLPRRQYPAAHPRGADRRAAHYRSGPRGDQRPADLKSREIPGSCLARGRKTRYHGADAGGD